MLPRVLCVKHLFAPFYNHRVVNVASSYGDVLVVANSESARVSGFSLTICDLADIVVGVNHEWKSSSGILIAVWNWGGSSGSDGSRSIYSAE